MRPCPHCGTSIRPGVRFCRQCGKAIRESDAPQTDSSICTYCGAALRSNARFCKECGKPLTTGPALVSDARPTCPNCAASVRPNAQFCPMCSRPLRASPPPPPPPPPPAQATYGRFGTGELLPLTAVANRYIILERIAQGGMGAVYKAQDQRLQGKLVAVKEMSESAIMPSERTRVLESFQREAELLARLDHPNLVRVTDRFQAGARHYMVMEYIEGQTLNQMLQDVVEPFREEQVLVWADQLCGVLSYLHSQTPKIIYRDVKPANVMIVDSSAAVKLIDFGIARFFKPGKGRDTIEFGTDGYAPPEQYGKSQTNEQADIYALGATLHQLLTLRNPITEMFIFPPVRSLNPKVSRQVEAAVAKAVEAKQDERHKSIKEMRAALTGESVKSRPPKRKKKKTSAPPAKPATPQSTVSTGPSQVSFDPTSIDFGTVQVGDSVPAHSLAITFPDDEEITLACEALWLQIDPKNVSKSDSKVTIKLDSVRLKAGRLRLQGGWLRRWFGWPARFLVPAEQNAHTHLELRPKTGQIQQVPVSVSVVPRPSQVKVGWVMTFGVVLLEVAVLIGVVGVLAAIFIFGLI